MNPNFIAYVRVIINNRRIWVPSLLLVTISVVTIFVHESTSQRTDSTLTSISFKPSSSDPFETPYSLTYNEAKLLLDKLFDPISPLSEIQKHWNKLIQLWSEILKKFVNDACEMCHRNELYCLESVDIPQYIYYMNQSFYPSDDTKRPIGFGLYYYFDLKTLHVVNNTILPTDVSSCDYFHMMQLMIHVQTVLHQAQIKYFLTKGTLIGVLRHHDVIPWDTDIDIFIPSTATGRILKLFKELIVTGKSTTTIKSNTTTTEKATEHNTDQGSFKKDLVVYRFRNIYKVTSYKIFSIRSPIVNRTNYRWPKIDIFPYEENSTHIYAYPKHRHNLGTMSHIAKHHIEPVYLRILGPLLVPSPHNPRLSLQAMVRLGKANVFYACEGNTFLHRYNRGPADNWRVPCLELHKTYPFVYSQRNDTSRLCFEELKYPRLDQSLSLYKYECAEALPRTL